MSQAGTYGSGGGGGSVTSVSGTSNQITSTGTTSVVLSIPSTFIAPGSIASTTSLAAGNLTTAGIVFNSVTTGILTSYAATNHTVQLGNSSGQLKSLTNGTTGQVLTATTGSDPSWQAAAGGIASVTGTANQIDVTAGSTPVVSLDAAIITPGTLTVAGNFAITSPSTASTINFRGIHSGYTGSNSISGQFGTQTVGSGSGNPCSPAFTYAVASGTAVAIYYQVIGVQAAAGSPPPYQGGACYVSQGITGWTCSTNAPTTVNPLSNNNIDVEFNQPYSIQFTASSSGSNVGKLIWYWSGGTPGTWNWVMNYTIVTVTTNA